MLAPTIRSHRKHVEPVAQKTSKFKKGNVVVIDGVQRIVIATLAADATSPATYSVCDTELRNSEFGLDLSQARLADPEDISEITKRRASNFI